MTNLTLESTLLSALDWLDLLLQRAVDAAKVVYGSDLGADPYCGLYIDGEEVESLLAREPGAPLLYNADGLANVDWLTTEDESTIARLAKAYRLSSFDRAVILIALSVEIDLRYERLFAYLQDDVTRRRPTVDLVLNLLCKSRSAKLACRSHFSPQSALFSHDLLKLIPDTNQLQPPLLSHYVQLDVQIIRFLLQDNSLDSELASFCEIIRPTVTLESLPFAPDLKRHFQAWQDRLPSHGELLHISLNGQFAADRALFAEALAAEAQMPLLKADLRLMPATAQAPIKRLMREAWMREAVIYVEGADRLNELSPAVHPDDCVPGCPHRLVIFSADSTTINDQFLNGALCVQLTMPTPEDAQVFWQSQLQQTDLSVSQAGTEQLSEDFPLTPSQIHAVVAAVGQQMRWSAEASIEGQRSLKHRLRAAARAQFGQTLQTLGQKIVSRRTWDDLVLPDDILRQLREICARVVYRHSVLNGWGFASKLSNGKGINALFVGASGTGKTLAAEVIANDLQLDLFKINLAGVVSKYIGETEKNLERIFTAAERGNVILFFDEADALFGKRSDVHDAHDRYANLEISYLLQKMEQYPGVTILATNLRQNIDEAFTRRLQFIVEFPFPDETLRFQLWQTLLPSAAPRVELDYAWLARQYRLTGGNIRNIVLGAAFLAAETGGAMCMDHLMYAARREYQKMGKLLSEADFARGPISAMHDLRIER